MKRVGSIFSFAILLGIAGAGVFAFLNQQAIYDWVRLRDYTPPAAIEELAVATTMNEDAQRLFYVQHPELNEREAFNTNCGQITEVTIVLGCYISGEGIYIFDVDNDPRLHGVEHVTAAHELLHAAYERLDDEEQARINQLTNQTFEALTDERIIKNIRSYNERDPSVVPNELHSILGTEVRNLPKELEEYYKRYFKDRMKIVSLSEKYESELTKRRNRAAALEVQIASLQNEIENLEQSLTLERERLERQRPNVNTQAEVVAFNARVDAYNADISQLNNLIDQHNVLVQEYKANAIEQEELFKALNSQPTL